MVNIEVILCTLLPSQYVQQLFKLEERCWMCLTVSYIALHLTTVRMTDNNTLPGRFLKCVDIEQIISNYKRIENINCTQQVCHTV